MPPSFSLPAPQLAADPALRRKLARLSAGSFARLVELFSRREGSPRSSPARRPSMPPCPGPPPPSPEPLARLALAMELSRRVAWLGGSLAGLSVEHVHSFTPWIQAHGGWVSIGEDRGWLLQLPQLRDKALPHAVKTWKHGD